MRVKARAVIWIDGKLIVAEQRRRGRQDVSLPGGRVDEHESALDAVRREVTEETGLTVVPRQLLYVFEVVASVRITAVELIFLAEAGGVPNLGRLRALNLDDCAERSDVRPPILREIARDHALGWRENPRWAWEPRPPEAARDTPTVSTANATDALVDHGCDQVIQTSSTWLSTQRTRARRSAAVSVRS